MVDGLMAKPTRHIVKRASESAPELPAAFAGHSTGFARWAAIDHTTPGAVHTGFGVNHLAAGGSVDGHVHSFEETFYVMSGALTVDTVEGSFTLCQGDYGVVPTGSPHAFRNLGEEEAVWADMLAPQPQPDFEGDTFFVPDAPKAGEPIDVDARDPRTRSFGNITPDNMDPTRQTQDLLALSASMRTALLVYSGITVKMMVDSDLGAHLLTMFMVQYEPDGVAGAHDHPLEETYMIEEGTTIARFDGEEYLLEPGDIAFAGVGCVHEFSNTGPGIVRWLETQAPQPPARHSYRFARDWSYLRDALD
jgi:quercetin dioxygenase-like cupin family protein